MRRPESREPQRVLLPDRDLLAESILSDLELAILMAPDDEPILRLAAMWEDLKGGRVR